MTLRDVQLQAARSAVSRFGIVGVAAVAGVFLTAQVSSGQTPQYQSPISAPAPQVSFPVPTAITPNGHVVEDVIVQVNDQVINRSDLERAEEQLQAEAQQTGMSAADLADAQHNLLRDLIDKQLLLSRGKELGINADTEVIRRLDEIRKQNHLGSLEDLQKAAQQQGVSYEDFKANIRNNIISQEVVRDEVGRHLQMSPGQEQAFYDAHKQEFAQPEQVRLSEILIPLPADATDAAIAQAQAKADGIAKQIKAGDSFESLAKLVSGGQTAAQGGDLGLFKRGALAKVLEDQTFDLKPGQNTGPIRTRQGFVILKVTEHIAAGVQPLKDVEQQVQEAMYNEQIQPALRAYLTKLRENAYIDIKAGFVDSGASSKETKPVFSAYAAPLSKKQKKAAKKRFDRGGRLNASAGRPAAVAKPAIIKLDKHGKPKKVKREKIRFGQSPEQALPPGPTTLASGAGAGGSASQATGPEGGQNRSLGTADAKADAAPGTAIAPLEGSSISGTSLDPDSDPLGPRTGPQKKSRFSDRAPEVKFRKQKKKAAKIEEKKIATPAAPTTTEQQTKQLQAAPLGLNGDTAKKKKHKRKKGEAKQRLAPKPADPNAPKPDANGNYPTPYHPATPNTPTPATPPNQ
jgi:peptidyl-prolyl cis-trans isomerase SurA